jgi:excinuclease ABC subunit B
MSFTLEAPYQPTGDQPEAIRQLVEGLKAGQRAQTLLGVTGSGKTFTVANVIKVVNRPTLVLSHNKTLAAQLYSEFKEFFPQNAVEYFVSYYDYYQPEAYLPVTDTYIEKDLSINDEIEKLRLSATSSLLSGRRDVLVVASVSCIYGIGNPTDFRKGITPIQVGMTVPRNQFLLRLVSILYSRMVAGELQRGQFRVQGDTVDIHLAYADIVLRVAFWGDEIESIETLHPVTMKRIEQFQDYNIYPANIFVTTKETTTLATNEIRIDLGDRVEWYRQRDRILEAKRIEERVNFDLEMIQELGYCNGIENYSRYFDRRTPGQRPFCLIDYFPDDFLLVVDESHVTVSQVRGMYAGDRSRKENLVEYAFRLPAALDNRPLKFDEFQSLIGQVIYVSATPADFELEESEGLVVEQLIRPTGLLDPEIVVRPTHGQIDDLMEEIALRVERQERVLITTLTKKMAEELADFLDRNGVSCRYIHSEVDTLDRVDILQGLRDGVFDVLIGVNLLREGIDLPEVSLVAIMDADKEGFLRSERSLVQTVGRAARNVNGMVIMYADKITASMRATIDETQRRRIRQEEYNKEHGITPTQIVKKRQNILSRERKTPAGATYYIESEPQLLNDPVVQMMDKAQLEKLIVQTRRKMETAARDMNFMDAARLRDEMYALQKAVEGMAEQK